MMTEADRAYENMLKQFAKSRAAQPTLRDQFAMAALPVCTFVSGNYDAGWDARMAMRAYQIADAMLAAREAKKEETP